VLLGLEGLRVWQWQTNMGVGPSDWAVLLEELGQEEMCRREGHTKRHVCVGRRLGDGGDGEWWRRRLGRSVTCVVGTRFSFDVGSQSVRHQWNRSCRRLGESSTKGLFGLWFGIGGHVRHLGVGCVRVHTGAGGGCGASRGLEARVH
jgi:hypothetical protein